LGLPTLLRITTLDTATTSTAPHTGWSTARSSARTRASKQSRSASVCSARPRSRNRAGVGAPSWTERRVLLMKDCVYVIDLVPARTGQARCRYEPEAAGAEPADRIAGSAAACRPLRNVRPTDRRGGRSRAAGALSRPARTRPLDSGDPAGDPRRDRRARDRRPLPKQRSEAARGCPPRCRAGQGRSSVRAPRRISDSAPWRSDA
jgi:hypothetical protein